MEELSKLKKERGVLLPGLSERDFLNIFKRVIVVKTRNINLRAGVSFILFIFFILIIFTHRKNISNLKNKTEQKIRI